MGDVREARSAYYSNKVVSRGRASSFEVREDTDTGKIAFRGYASITDQSYEVWDWLGEYQETIVRGAFGKSLREQDDCRLLVNHDGVPLARTKSGTMTLREILDPKDDPQGRGQTGLWVEALDLDPANPTVQEVRSAMTRGDISEMSFGFQATRQEWNEDWTERSVLEVRLFDVSIVTYPANPATSATLSDRSADVMRQTVFAQLDAGRALSADQREFVREAIQQRDALIAVNITVTQTETEYETEIEEEEPDELTDVVGERSAALARARFERAKYEGSRLTA